MSSLRQGISEMVQICLQHDIDHAVISPGSRNAPLIIHFAKNKLFRCFSIADERSACYFALGIAGQLQKPVVLICTSGTAALNYAPGIAEAYYQKVPLLVLTADRPPEWIDQDDGQSIRQQNIFSPFIKKSFTFPLETGNEDDLWHAHRIISEAINLSLSNGPGPVHVNIPLREPLYTLNKPVGNPVPTFFITENKKTLSDRQWATITDKWDTFNKRLVVAGIMTGDEGLNKLVGEMVEGNEIAVMAENISNLSHPEFIETPEPFIKSLSSDEKENFRPELLITIGGSVVSKELKTFLRLYQPEEHWHVDENDLFIDTYKGLTQNIRVNATEFFKKVIGRKNNDESYTHLIRSNLKRIDAKQQEFIQTAGFSDLTAYHTILNHLPSGCNLHLANSTPVRYSQLFKVNPGVIYNSNRGVSGIDGCVSTAAGAAIVNNRLTVLFSGDIAFVYDSNGLWNNELPHNLRIIVFNNDGGNIFKIIQSNPELEDIQHFFETPHHVDIKKLVEAYGCDHCYAANQNELKKALQSFFKPNKRAIVLEVKTYGIESAKAIKEYYKYLSR